MTRTPFPPNAVRIALLAAVVLFSGCGGGPTFESRRNAAIDLYKGGEIREAADELMKLSVEEKGDFQTRYYLGRCYEDLGEYESAEQEWDAVIRIRPAFAEAFYRKGNSLVTQKKRAEALQAWDEALRIQPDYAEASFNCAVTLEQMQRYDDAVSMYTRAILSDSTFLPAHHNLGRLLQLAEHWDLALQRYQALVELDPENSGAHMNLIRMLIKLERGEEAVREIDRYIADRSPSEQERDSLAVYSTRIETP